MGANAWEEGTITVPSADFSKIRQAVQKEETRHLQEVFDLTQEFWKGLTRKQQTDRGEYGRAIHTFMEQKGRVRAHFSSDPWRNRPGDWTRDKALLGFNAAVSRSKPARVLKTDMAFPTNRTTEFGNDGCRISFVKAANTIQWSVGENKNARERAHATPWARALFKALDEVRWTRGTGGFFEGNDEYNTEDHGAGGGGNYVTTAFGPIGAAEAPDECRPYTDSKGKRVTEDTLRALGRAKMEAQWAAQRAANEAYAKSVKASGIQPRGHNGHAGQYTYRLNAEPGFRL